MFLMSPRERLVEWRRFRLSLLNMSEYDQLVSIANLWGKCPRIQWVIDSDKTDQWPTPWQIINDGLYCNTTVAYMMEQSLILENNIWDGRLVLAFINDTILNDNLMVLIVDKKYVLNYSVNEVVDFNKMTQHWLIKYCYKRKNGVLVEEPYTILFDIK